MEKEEEEGQIFHQFPTFTSSTFESPIFYGGRFVPSRPSVLGPCNHGIPQRRGRGPTVGDLKDPLPLFRDKPIR